MEEEKEKEKGKLVYQLDDYYELELRELMQELVGAIQDMASHLQRIDSRLKAGIVTYPQKDYIRD